MFVIDSNFLIYMNKEIPANSGDELWDKLLILSRQDYLKIPEKVIEELERGTDELADWIKANKRDLILRTVDAADSLAVVMSEYAKGVGNVPFDDLDALDKIADPYVIAHALQVGGTVVTSEVFSRGNYLTKAPKNRKIPDICNSLKIPVIKSLIFFRDISRIQ